MFINYGPISAHMRFRTALITSLAILILLILLLLGQQTLVSQLMLSILFGMIIIFQLILLLIDDEFSVSHIFITGSLFLSLGYLVLNILGKPSLSTFFLGGMFILLYLLDMVLILIYNWKQYTMFDRMIASMQDKNEDFQRPKAPPVVPVERLIDEPPHVRLRHNDEEEWVEIKIKKSKKATRKKAAKKIAKKKSSRKVKR